MGNPRWLCAVARLQRPNGQLRDGTYSVDAGIVLDFYHVSRVFSLLVPAGGVARVR